MRMLSTTEEEEEHAQENEHEVEDFAAQVFLVEQDGCTGETDYYAASSYHADDAYHGVGEREGIEVGKVGCREEYAYKYDCKQVILALAELELLRYATPIYNKEYDCHEKALIDVVPTLHNHAVEPYPTLADGCHEVSVVESADGAEDALQHNKEYPFVVAEVDAFALSAAAEHIERRDGKHDSNPLIKVEPLTKHEDCAYQYHDRTRGIDWSGDG